MNFERRIRALEYTVALGAVLRAPDYDPRSELIKRINQVAARAQALGVMPPTDEVGQARFVASFQDWARRRRA